MNMNIRPIPNELLGESFILIMPTITGTVETEIINVRAELTESIEGYATDATRSRSILTVWVDFANSTWAEFPVGAKVRYRGKEYEIIEQKVYRLRILGDPHHCRFKAIRIGDGNI